MFISFPPLPFPLFVSLIHLHSHIVRICLFLSLFCPLPPNVYHFFSHPAPVCLFLHLLCSFPFLLSYCLTTPHTHAGTSSFNKQLFREVGITPLCLGLYPDSQPECPLRLWSAVELLSGKQQPSRLQCASWIETLPYKALGTVAPANFFSAKQASLSAPHLLWGDGQASLWSFFGFCSTPVKKTRRLPGVQALSSLKMSHFTLLMYWLVLFSGQN